MSGAEEPRESLFLPCTRNVEIGDGIVYRPIRSWHAGTFAGEQRVQIIGDRRMTSPPYSAIHRLYWRIQAPKRCVSAFLSYPNGLGAMPTYFWEISIGDCERFTGVRAEEEMEAAIKGFLLDGTLLPSADPAALPKREV